jgi:hypothetical protein
MQKLKSNKQADERKDKTMKKMHGQIETQSCDSWRRTVLILQLFCRQLILHITGSPEQKMQNIMRKKNEQNKGQRDRSARARASKRAQQRGAADGFHPAPFGYVGLGLLSSGYVLPGIPSPGLLFLSNSQKI